MMVVKAVPQWLKVGQTAFKGMYFYWHSQSIMGVGGSVMYKSVQQWWST